LEIYFHNRLTLKHATSGLVTWLTNDIDLATRLWFIICSCQHWLV